MSRATRVLVTGAAGQVGVDLCDTLAGDPPPGGDPHYLPDGRPVARDEFEVLGLSRHDLDVTDDDAVVKALRAATPDVVVHLAAFTAVDRAEEDPERCYQVNEAATMLLSRAALSVGAHFITISTDYVFDGTKGEAYVEDDEANPLNVYGASKYAAELHCTEADTVVRTSWVMGVRGQSVVHAIAERAVSGANVRFVSDQMGTVTTASDLARALVTMVRERPGGTWHVANTGTTTWYDLAAYVGGLLNRDEEFATPITTAELVPAPLAQRPARSDLDTSKFASHYVAMPDWHDGVARLVYDRQRREGLAP